MHQKFGIATRFYGLSEGDVRRLAEWVDAAVSIVPAANVYVAIHTEADLSGSLDFMREKYPGVTAFPVTPWGRVVQAPNALLLKCAEAQVSHLLCTCSKYPTVKTLLASLEPYSDDQPLVVGARLPNHDFKAHPGKTVLVEKAGGLQIPWNTCALWSVEHLIHTGFVLTADSVSDPNNAGMEEMGTIAAQQILWPTKAIAKLVAVGEEDLVSNTHGWTIERSERHAHIMKTKNYRSEMQLERLLVSPPSVYHIG